MRPYSTWLSEASFVVHWTVALVPPTLVTATPLITGGVMSVVVNVESPLVARLPVAPGPLFVTVNLIGAVLPPLTGCEPKSPTVGAIFRPEGAGTGGGGDLAGWHCAPMTARLAPTTTNASA